eukprot:1830760-Rhodomonas_salina.2
MVVTIPAILKSLNRQVDERSRRTGQSKRNVRVGNGIVGASADSGSYPRMQFRTPSIDNLAFVFPMSPPDTAKIASCEGDPTLPMSVLPAARGCRHFSLALVARHSTSVMFRA